MMCGLPASGKTTIGTQLATHLGGVIIRSCDVYRDLGISLPAWVHRTRRFTEHVADYERERDRAYEAMARRLRATLAASPRVIVVDAVHGERAKRQVVYEICAAQGLTPTILWCQCEDMNEIRRRFALRVDHESEPEHEASDLSVFQHIRSLWEAPDKDRLPSGPPVPIVSCDTLHRACRPANADAAPAMAVIRPALAALGRWRIDD